MRRFSSDRVLQAHVGDVAADGGVLAVLAVLRRDVFEGTVPDGFLQTETLHLVHVDRTHSCQTETPRTHQISCSFYHGNTGH